MNGVGKRSGSGGGTVVGGIGIAMFAHAVGLGLPLLFLPNGAEILILFGLYQLIYMAPLLIVLIAKKQAPRAKGVALIVGLSFLVNATCWGVVIATFSYQN